LRTSQGLMIDDKPGWGEVAPVRQTTADEIKAGSIVVKPPVSLVAAFSVF
jgi:hypothetical protein